MTAVSIAPVVGVDLGGTNMQIGVVGPANTVLADRRGKTAAQDGAAAVVDRIAAAIVAACADAGVELGELEGIGIAAPGAIDIPRGVVIEAPNLGWTDYPLRDELQSRLGCPVVVDNDVNAAAWGEHKLGAGRGCKDLLGIWLGTGVGGGLVLDGRLYHGPLFTAGEVGQTVIMPDGPRTERTVEDHCSRTGMARIIRKRLPEFPGSILHELTRETGGRATTGALVAALSAGDELAVQVIDRAAYLLGIAIANWVTVLALDRILIGGGIGEAFGAPFLAKVCQSFEADVFPQRHRSCNLRLTELRENAGLLGAAMLAKRRL